MVSPRTSAGEELVRFGFRENIKTLGTTRAYVIKDGRVLTPAHQRRSRTGSHGEDYYYARDVDEADVILFVEISNSGKHYCRMVIKRQNDASVAKAYEIHRCPEMKVEGSDRPLWSPGPEDSSEVNRG